MKSRCVCVCVCVRLPLSCQPPVLNFLSVWQTLLHIKTKTLPETNRSQIKVTSALFLKKKHTVKDSNQWLQEQKLLKIIFLMIHLFKFLTTVTLTISPCSQYHLQMSCLISSSAKSTTFQSANI